MEWNSINWNANTLISPSFCEVFVRHLAWLILLLVEFDSVFLCSVQLLLMSFSNVNPVIEVFQLDMRDCILWNGSHTICNFFQQSRKVEFLIRLQTILWYFISFKVNVIVYITTTLYNFVEICLPLHLTGSKNYCNIRNNNKCINMGSASQTCSTDDKFRCGPF